ncbi:AT-rich interactive domain-containing protein 2-like isoform X2 [Paramacrobiotus metropolitanus]|uniref:AT-rich interactive domain-containing protein 2-like isoform X2 n=1 Tax=Paramacrobiotus metropolitanus TaxID=2943436 RepID=UPI0024458031|nr:AT-rich interactive domain-containing protein 2-like isoform X2 [Paramacrobiotus metropolitanus]
MLKSPCSSATSQFAEDLFRFLGANGQKAPNVPQFNGKPVNLLLLYQTVISRGGWQRVCHQNGWESVAYALGMPKPCANAGHAVKSLYYQYLLKYECSQFNRTPVEDDDDDALKRFSINGPGYSRLPEYLRVACGLPNDAKEEDPFEKLTLSLSSGLPNEIDFSINALLVRSSDAVRPLMLRNSHSVLLDALLSSVAVFSADCGNFVGIYNSFIKQTDKDFLRYWKETINDEEILHLLDVDKRYEQPYTTSDLPVCDLFCETTSTDVNETRVTQIATILHNLTCEDANATFLTSHESCLKFVFLCASSRRSSVYDLGLEMLVQLVSKIDIRNCCPWIQDAIIKTVAKCIGNQDRLGVLQGLTLLAKIGDMEASHEAVTDSLDDGHYTSLSQYLCVSDTSIIIFSLEVLYKLSGLGDQQSTRIAEQPRTIELLVRLVTVTAEIAETNWQECDLDLDPNYSLRTTPALPVSQPSVITPAFSVPAISQEETDATVDWFRRLYDGDDSFAMAMSDVYKDYVVFCLHEMKITPAVTTFIHCFRLAFPQGRTTNLTIAGKPQLCFLGMKRRTGDNTSVKNTEHSSVTAISDNSAGSYSGSQTTLATPGRTISVDASLLIPNQAAFPVNAPPPLGGFRAFHTTPVSNGQQSKVGESSLIRSLLATKINRKHSSGSMDGTPENGSNHLPLGTWRSSEELNSIVANRGDGESVLENVFSDADSISSCASNQKPTSGSISSQTSVPEQQQPKKPPRRRKKAEAVIDGPLPMPNHTLPTNGLVNGVSHAFSDDSRSGTSTPLVVVPYVLPDSPKRPKKPRNKAKLNGLVDLPSLSSELPVNGHNGGLTISDPSTPENLPKPVRKPRKPRAKKQKTEEGPVNGHIEAPLEATETSTEPPAKKARKAATRRPRKAKAETAVAAVAANAASDSQAQLRNLDLEGPLDYLCEWEGCSRSFFNAALVFKHNFSDHIPSALDGMCRWPHCNGVKRQHLSLITHLNETHCSTMELVRQAMRRRDRQRNGVSSIPPPTPIPPPVAYSEHAALHSIQARYGSAVLSDFAAEAESSNTKTTRLTAALVLRNIAHYSHVGRIKLHRYEHVLTTSAMQLSEASQVVAECLYFLAVHKQSDENGNNCDVQR